ncbi:CTP synthase [Mycoplasma haemofelis Ohio2]|uniref:CTP synthase (glutamine hydrolyzing) n=1 Tax=Mycoplasma haemofelis (strain Ohio2) TaxID=859194 RepID=F6FH18_MYCHI|nr:CTP synthase [Mycoplasma haemofelis Ohio2]
MKRDTKVIFFTGGVFSSVGKGLTMANVGRILTELGFKVSVLKLDPYLNINSGNLSPEQHGEVYVTEDGHETDLDLGHYERFINYKLSKDSCITAGTIYKRLLEKQSSTISGDTIQAVPHLINEIHDSIDILLDKGSDFLLIEIGGTVGDIEAIPFLEAASRFRRRHGERNVYFIHVSPVFSLKTSGEFKTKPTQHSLKELISYNICPDLLVLRCPFRPEANVKAKISKSTDIPEENILYCLDAESIYLIAQNLYEEGIHRKICDYFGLQHEGKNIDAWISRTSKILSKDKKPMKIAMAGKYSAASDAYISIIESLKLASHELNIDLKIDYFSVDDLDNLDVLKDYKAICVPHGFGSRGVSGKISVIRYCRENKIPFLGICFGMQLACIEYMRNALNRDCDSVEIDPDTPLDLVIQLSSKEMRLGGKKISISDGTLAKEIYGKSEICSRHRHKYFLNPKYIPEFKDSDLVISAFSKEGGEEIAEMVELKNHPFFIATQFHPEFDTTVMEVSPLFMSFLRAGSK